MQVHDACPYVQISANWLLTLYRLLPMIYDSNQKHRKNDVTGFMGTVGVGGGGGVLCLLGVS